MKQYTGFVYQWTNKINNKKYIGSHYGKIDDGYVGSGIYFRRAYELDPSIFERTILDFCSGSHTELLSLEESWLSKIPDIANNDEYYNLTSSAGGGRNHDHLSDEYKNSIYQAMSAASKAKLAAMTEIEKKSLAKKKKDTWHSKPKQLAEHQENTRQRRKIEEALKSTEEKETFKSNCKSSYWGRSDEDLATAWNNQSAGVAAWHASKSAELEAQRIQNMKNTKKARKLKYIHEVSTGKVKQVPENDLPIWLSKGWTIGMKPKQPKIV